MHAQVFDDLQQRVETGELEPGSKLPTELQLAERYGVNRLTVRQALAELRRAGLVVPRQGVGTFVARRAQPLEVELNPGDWLVEAERGARAAAEQGRTISEQLIDIAELEAPAYVVSHLGKGRMLWIESCSHIDGVPSIRSQYWTRSERAPDEVRERARAKGFDATAVREAVGHDMYYAWRSFDAVPASRRAAEVLSVPVGSPLLRREGLNSDHIGRPLLYLRRDAPSGHMKILLRNQPPASLISRQPCDEPAGPTRIPGLPKATS